MKCVAFTAHKTAGVIDIPDYSNPLKPDELRGRTLVTLVSPGTELNSGFLGDAFPIHPGYASVFQIEEAGGEVRDLAVGDVVFGSGKHSARQQASRGDVIKLPADLPPEVAVFARLAGVSMSSLNATVVRPPATVLITGLGPVGILAGQIFAGAGYDVIAVDPASSRQQTASEVGLRDVRGVLDVEELRDRFHLHVECSGHEQAVLEGCRCVRKGGEIFLVGVPWRRKTEISSFELLREIFHRYVSVRSGWEWQVPVQPRDFAMNCIMDNLSAAQAWLAGGRLKVDGLADLYTPEQAQVVYSGLLDQSLPTPTAVFDWRGA